MLHSLKDLLGRFPYFLDYREGSNFYKSECVFNEWFMEVYNDVYLTYISNSLNKPLLIYKEQNNKTEYQIHFIINTKYLKKINILRLKPDNTLTNILQEEQSSINIIQATTTDEKNNTLIDYVNDKQSPNLLNLLKEENYIQSQNNTYIHLTYSPTTPNIKDDVMDDKFICSLETWDEHYIIKGFPENDEQTNKTIVTEEYTNYDGCLNEWVEDIIITDGETDTVQFKQNIFNHDYGLDKLGLTLDVPRKNYIHVDKAFLDTTEPPFNNQLTEDDYHYLKRIISYTAGKQYVQQKDGSNKQVPFNLQSTALPCLEIWKLYGVTASIRNREYRLCKMIDGHKHFLFDENDQPIFDQYGKHIRNTNYTRMSWEHEDLMCTTGDNADYFLFVTVNNHTPISGSDIEFKFNIMNQYGETIDLPDSVIVPYIENSEEIMVAYNYPDYPKIKDKNTWRINTSKLVDYNNILFKFKLFLNIDDCINELEAHSGELVIDDDSIVSDDILIKILGCDTADYYVNYLTGDDDNSGSKEQPFKTLTEAINKVESGQLIVLQGEEHHISDTLTIPCTCTIMGCGNNTVLYSANRSVFKLMQDVNLTLANLKLKYKCCMYTAVVESVQNYSKIYNPVYISLAKRICKKDTELTSNTLHDYTTADEILINGVLMCEESMIGLPNKNITVKVGDSEYTGVTDSSGVFNISIGCLLEGDYEFTILFNEDEGYCNSEIKDTLKVKKVESIIEVNPTFEEGVSTLLNIPFKVKTDIKVNNHTVQVKLIDGDSVLQETTVSIVDGVGEGKFTYSSNIPVSKNLLLQTVEDDVVYSNSATITVTISEIFYEVINDSDLIKADITVLDTLPADISEYGEDDIIAVMDNTGESNVIIVDDSTELSADDLGDDLVVKVTEDMSKVNLLIKDKEQS